MAIARDVEGIATRRAGEQRIRFRISLMLAVSIGTLVVLAVLSVLVIQLWVSRQNTLDLLNEKAGFILQSVEQDIASYLAPVRSQINYLAIQIESGAYDLADKEQLRVLLTGALAPLPQVDRIVVLDPSLQLFAVRRGPLGEVETMERDRSKSPAALALRDRLWRATGAVWGDLIHVNEKSYLSLQRALRKDGKLLGYLAIGVSTLELSQLTDETSALLSASLDDGSDSVLATAFILYGPHKVLAHANLISDSSRQSYSSPATDLDEIGDLVLSSLWSGIPVPGFERSAADDVNVVSISQGGLDHVAIYKWIGDYGDVPWAIGLWTHASDLDGELRRLEKAALAGLVVALMAVLAAIAVGRFVSKPIQEVSLNALKVGDFDLKEIENLPPSRIKELDDEAAAFNTMLSGLRSFETYVPRALVARLMRAEGSVESEQRRMTVMFTDMVGFTTVSENLSASEVASFLNEHFSRLGDCVEAEGGTIDKFIGDSLMAFWGAPEHQEHTEQRACRAALAIAKAVTVKNETRRAEGQPVVRLRIGIHTGDVVVGNIGSPGRINYTIVGDTVNTCQRLEVLGKEVDPDAETIVLISKATADALDGTFDVQTVGRFEVKGRAEMVEVFRLAV